MFTVELFDRSHAHIGPTPMRFKPKRWGANVRGGHETAEIEVSGKATDLEDLLNALRYGVIIRNRGGHPVWWGYVHEVQLNIYSTTTTLTMDKLANRVRAKYSYESGEGSQSGTTAWQEDSRSQINYGIKEMQIEAADSNSDAAVEKAKRALDKYKKATGVPSPTGQQGAASALLTCRGWFDTLDWRYWEQPLGRIVHNPSSDASALLGWGFQGLIGFGRGDKTIHQIDCKLVGLRVGDRIVISGSFAPNSSPPYNDGTYTVAEAPSQEKVVTYTADTITFDPGDDIFDLDGGGLAPFKTGEMISVSGTGGANDKYHMLDGDGTDQITTWTGWNGVIFFWDSGVPVTLTQGCHITVEEDFVKAIPGAGGSNPILKVTSQKLAQRFTPTETGTWLVGEIAVYIKRWGTPADNVKLELFTDSAGAIGTLIEDATFTGTDIQKDEMRVVFAMDGINSVTNGTYYWLILSRTGGYEFDNYYEVSLTVSEVVGALLEFDGTTWPSRTPAATMLYEVWGVRETTLQIQDINSGSLLAGTDIKQASGIKKTMYRDGNRTKLEEIVDLLKFGVSDGRYLFAEVSLERILRVYASPTYDKTTALIWRNGELMGQSNAKLAQGILPYGQWLILADFSDTTNQIAQLSPVLLDTVEYDAENDQYTWSAYGAEDRFS